MVLVNGNIISLSDCSIILECTDERVAQTCPIVIHVPEVSEEFFMQYFRSLYPLQTKEWNNSFIQGYFLLKQSVPEEVAHNFTVI